MVICVEEDAFALRVQFAQWPPEKHLHEAHRRSHEAWVGRKW